MPRRLDLIEDAAELASVGANYITHAVTAPGRIVRNIKNHGLSETARIEKEMALGFEELAYEKAEKVLPKAFMDRMNKPKSKLALPPPQASDKSNPRHLIPAIRNIDESPMPKKISSTLATKPKAYVTAPAAMSVSRQSKPPRVTGTANGLVVSHREYVGDIIATGSANWSIAQILPLDPAEPGTFPWLAPVACQYQRFRLRKLNVEYVADCSSSTAGSVLITYNRGVGTVLPATKQQQLEAETIRCSAWQNANYTFKVENNMYWTSPYYNLPNVTATNTPYTTGANDASNLNVAGRLILATSGTTGSVGLGEVYINYEFEFIAPISTLPVLQFTDLQIISCSSTDFFSTCPVSAQTLVTNANMLICGTMSIQGLSGNNPSIGFQLLGPSYLLVSAPITGSTSTLVCTSPTSGVTINTVFNAASSGLVVGKFYIHANQNLYGFGNGIQLVLSATNLNVSSGVPGRISIFSGGPPYTGFVQP